MRKRRIHSRAIIIAFAAVLGAGNLYAQQDSCGIPKLPENAASFYPPIARAAHVTGKVVLLASFDHDGRATVTKVIDGYNMLRDASVKLVQASLASPSNGSRERPITVEFHLEPAQYDNDCKVTNSVPNSRATTPAHMDVFALGASTCDPAVTITMPLVKHRFLFFHWYTKTKFSDRH